MKILGINDGHNASAILLEDGVVVAGLQEERLSRLKNQPGFPARAVRWVLESTGTDPGDLDFVAMHSRHSPYPKTREEMIAEYAASQSLSSSLKQAVKRTAATTHYRNKRRAVRRADVARAGLPLERTIFVDHHTCHAAAAYHGSPWKDEKVLVLTADGMGDDLCATVRIGERGRLGEPIATVDDSHSLGSIYAKITFVLGMIPNEHEYKLMGMAPYAPASGAEKSYERFKNLFVWDGNGKLTWRRAPGVPHTYYSYKFFRDLVERHRFDWISAGLQRFTEEHLARWAQSAIRATGVRKLALGGGVFMNVKANQRIYELDDVDGLFVFPSCGDEMNAAGAAFHVHATEKARRGDGAGIPPLGAIYWGAAPVDADIEPLLPDLRAKGYGVERHDDVETVVADLLAAGEVVARADGREEFGARALGNRSILADPTKKEVIRIINDMIKKRDFWMPFAPAMLAERSDEYVVNPKRMDAPWMIMTFAATDRLDEFPAGVQPYDRTARPQFVHAEHNPAFHRIISRFREKTGRGVVLNTSFNLHGLPIVSSAADAVEVLEQSGLPILAVGRWLVRKPDAALRREAR
jgi:carbamoyltransferase